MSHMPLYTCANEIFRLFICFLVSSVSLEHGYIIHNTVFIKSDQFAKGFLLFSVSVKNKEMRYLCLPCLPRFLSGVNCSKEAFSTVMLLL
jgi:hypothetical protein